MNIKQRIERLEHQNKLYRNLFVLIGVVVVSVVSLRQAEGVQE